MHYFLDPEFNPLTGILNEEESRHATKALRLAEGSLLEVGDGKGNRYNCSVKYVGKKELVLNVQESNFVPLPHHRLCIAIAPTKNPSRFEWFLEKVTELGVDRIIPLLSSRTERPRIRRDRMEKIIRSAAKQSQRAHIPKLDELTNFEDVLKLEDKPKYIAHCEASSDKVAISKVKFTEENTLILIGPEGDFTTDEIALANAQGLKGLDLGKNRLRTETAGVFVAAVFAGNQT